MDALSLLTERHSTAALQAPAPSGQDLETIKRAALTAPDHAGLHPWRHIVVSGEGLQRLADIFVAAAKRKQLEETLVERAAKMPFRAPMIVISVVKVTAHPKVPEIEQYLSAGCGVMAMLQAAQALGFGGMWRTGNYAYDETVHQALGLADDEHIVSYLYLGTPKNQPRKHRELPTEQFFSTLTS